MRASSGCARSTAASSSTGRRRSRTCSSRPAIPGLQRPGGAARTTRAPSTRTSRTNTPTTVDGGRRRARGGDRVAERARCGRRGRVGAPARAGAAAAQRPARVVLAPRSRRLPPHAPARAAPRCCARCWRLVSARARAGTSRSRAPREGRFRVEQSLNGAEQVICATGFRRGFQHDPLLRALVEEHDLETSGGGSCSTPTRRSRR